MDSQQEKLLRSRNAELEKELAQKIRDLEIEALEKVRARRYGYAAKRRTGRNSFCSV